MFININIFYKNQLLPINQTNLIRSWTLITERDPRSKIELKSPCGILEFGNALMLSVSLNDNSTGLNTVAAPGFWFGGIKGSRVGRPSRRGLYGACSLPAGVEGQSPWLGLGRSPRKCSKFA